MSDNHSVRTKLVRLADALVEDIIGRSAAEIIADTDKKDIERARAILGAAKQEMSKRFLVMAKSDFEKWRTAQSKEVTSYDPAKTKVIFEKIRAGDEEFNRKIMLAARNGETPSEADVAGLVNDYFDLQRLDKEDEQK
jgi:hypothetical protein